MPTCLPTSQSTRPQTARYAGTTIQRSRIVPYTILWKAGRIRSMKPFLAAGSSAR